MAAIPAHSEEALPDRVVTQVRKLSADVPNAAPLVAVRDAETGELRAPTPEEWARIEPYVKRTSQHTEGLVETTFSDGSVNLQLDERFHSYSIARKSQSGAVAHQCTPDSHTLANLILGSEAPAVEARDDQ